MPNFNRVIVAGHLGKDPELRYLPNNTAVVSFSMALSEKWKDKTTGDQQERTSWVDIEAFGRPAEVLNQYLRKGDPVLVEGKLRQDVWESDGQKRSKVKIVCENFTFLKGKSDGNEHPRQQQQRQPQPQSNYQTDGAPVSESDIPF